PYFSTIGTRIIRGRAFTASEDRPTAEPIAIVSVALANAFWPSGNAIGQCVRLGADTMPCRRIVGIAEGTQVSAIEPNSPTSPYASIVYVPLSQEGRHAIQARELIAHITGSPADIISRVRASIQRAEPNMPLAKITLMQSLLDPELRPWRLGATMCTVFGGLALVLAALGLYSVVSYSVTQRMREMGIRLALGARSTNILLLIGKEAAGLGMLGVLVAMGCAALLAPLVQPLLFHVSARSIAIYMLVGGGMLVVAIAASLVPAVRAANANPGSVMRSE
ncbi:MAG TPA: FtsX-like permease family protein, partial [Gemmatimonadaceae bacterium]|nr:FtsX-like permease family protein [Gemmatimonadaceae bacterium]